MYHKEGYEVTTYRVDGEYEDGRHPKDVTFTASLREDLRRRDFTINAMAYHPELGLVDLFGGLEDLKDKKVRCVGDPLERFTEDALRIMRAVRFSAQLGFTIEEETYHALSVLAPNLHQISAERIRTELEKILLSPHPDYVRTAYETGMTKVFLPEWDACMETPQNTPHHCYTVGEHILHSLSGVPAERVLRLAMFLHDIGKPVVRRMDENGRDHFKGHGPVGEEMARTILRRLKYDNDTIASVSRLVKWHDARPNPDMRSVRRAVNRIGDDLFPLYLKVRRADILAQSTYRREEKLKLLDETEACYQEICRENQCTSLKMLAVNGRDLIALGYPTGKQIGAMLNLLLEHVLDHPQDNERGCLLELLPQLLENSKISDN
jgi:tRNA nucleotidyltransferase (CCA-adding enzyme)